MPNLSQDLDFDLFNWVADENPEETISEDVTEAPIEDLEVTEEVEDVQPTEDVQEETTETTEEVEPRKSTSDDDIDAIINDLLSQTEEVDDKIEEVKAEAENTGNADLLAMIDDLQTMIAEKNQTIEELNRKNEITSNRYMDAYSDSENYAFYKDTISKLDEDPNLKFLVNNYNNPNTEQKVIDRLAKMISDKTWVDVNEAINEAQKSSVGNALTDISSSWWDMSPVDDFDESDYSRDESLTALWF